MLTTPVDLPNDAQLGGIVEQFEPSTVLAACRNQLGDQFPDGQPSWTSARLIESLYHPGRYIRAAYALLEDDATPPDRFWPEGTIVYLHAPVRRGVSRRGTVLQLGHEAAEAYVFPMDRRLRGLRKFAKRDSAAQVWQQWINDIGGGIRLDPSSLRRVLLRYVPEQKWIAKLRAIGVNQASGDHSVQKIVVRSAARSACEALASRHEYVSWQFRSRGKKLRVPQVVALDRPRGLLAFRWAGGDSLLEALGHGSPNEILTRVVELLSALHALPIDGCPSLERLSAGGVIRRAKDAADDLAVACPEWSSDLADILRATRRELLSLGAPDLALLHNDFHWNQVRIRDDRMTLLDLERMCVGDPLIDVANFATQIRMLAAREDFNLDRETADRWAETFLAYWTRQTGEPIEPIRYRCYAVLSLLELARGMLRHLRPDWRRIAKSCMEAGAREVSLMSDGRPVP